MIRFDTLDKKPKVWNILILSVIMVVISAVLTLLGGKNFFMVQLVLFGIYLLAVIVLLCDAFLKQVRYNPYSYNTIYYSGFALFILSVLIAHIILTVDIIRAPGAYTELEIRTILSMLLDSAKTYMLFSFPFVLVFSIALCVSNISLIRHERKRLVNVLGIILSFLLVAGEIIVFLLNFSVSGSAMGVMVHEIVVNLIACIYLYFESMIIGAIIANLIVSRYDPEKNKDFVIILGCGFRKDGTPTPLLRGRIDRAIAFRKAQLEETGKDLIFITSGGQGPNEVTTESKCMKNYLLSQGIPEDRIIEEDQSTNTFQNMTNSKAKILEVNPEGKVAYSTTNYHVFRSGIYARRVKMRAQGMGAKTKWYFWPNATVREFVSILTSHRLKQGLILGGMILFYTVLAPFVYLY